MPYMAVFFPNWFKTAIFLRGNTKVFYILSFVKTKTIVSFDNRFSKLLIDLQHLKWLLVQRISGMLLR